MNGALLAAETFVWGVQGICRLHLLPCDPKLVLQQFSPPYDLLSLQQATTAMGLRSGLRPAETLSLPKFPVPFVALLKPKSVPQPGRLALILKCNEHAITYLEEDTQHSLTRTLDDFRPQFAGMVMLCVPGQGNRRPNQSGVDDEANTPNRTFD